MPRKPKDPLAPAPPKRVRKTKKETAAAAALAAAEAKAAAGMMETAYDPLMAGSGMMLMDDVYATHDGYGYYGNGFEPVSYSTATSTPSTMTPTSSGGSQGSMPGGQQLTPSSTPGSMQGAPGMRPGPGMGTPTPVGIPNGIHPLPHQMPTPTPIEFRIHDMNRRFYLFLNTGVQEKDYAQWWDAFSHEFFDEDAKMTFIITDEKGMKNEKFVIGRQLIPRYFRTLLDGGMNEMYYVIKGPSRETPTPDGLTTYECNQFMQVSKYELPYQSEVQTDAVIKLDFTPYEECYNYRIRNWVIELQPSQEFTLNPITREFTPLMLADNSKRRQIHCGMSPATLQALRFSVILEPMQLIMSTCKGQPQLTPQDALKRICFARHQQQENQRAAMMNAQNAQMMQQQQQQPVEEAKAKPTRKRTRKAPANPKGAKKGGAPASASPAPSAPFVSPQGIPPAMHFQGMPEVYVVGEPSMLGGEFREDERTIDKLENPNYDPNAAMRPHPAAGTPGMMAPPQMQPNGQPSLAQLQAHHQQLLAGGPSPQQGGQPPQPPVSHAHHLAMGNMGPPMTPAQQQQAHLASLQQQSPQAAHLAQMQAAQQQGQPPQGVSTPPGAGGMPNGLAPPPPPSGFEYLGGWSRPPTNHLIA